MYDPYQSCSRIIEPWQRGQTLGGAACMTILSPLLTGSPRGWHLLGSRNPRATQKGPLPATTGEAFRAPTGLVDGFGLKG